MAGRGRVHELRLKTNIVFGASSNAEPHWNYSLLSVFLHIQWKNVKKPQLEERKAPGIKRSRLTAHSLNTDTFKHLHWILSSCVISVKLLLAALSVQVQSRLSFS